MATTLRVEDSKRLVLGDTLSVLTVEILCPNEVYRVKVPTLFIDPRDSDIFSTLLSKAQVLVKLLNAQRDCDLLLVRAEQRAERMNK